MRFSNFRKGCMICTRTYETLRKEVLTHMKRILFLTILLALLLPLSAADTGSQPLQYEKGSQMFTFRFGPVVPAFMFRPNQSEQWLNFSETGFKVGGYGAIRYQGFIHPRLALGGELGYVFDYDQSDLFTTVPLQMKATYFPVQGTIEIPLSFGLGFSYNSYADTSFMSLLATVEAGASFYFTENWGITVSGGLQVIPELLLFNDAASDQATVMGFMPIALSLSYRGE